MAEMVGLAVSKFKLRFAVERLGELSRRYNAENEGVDDEIEKVIKPKVGRTGCLDRDSFLVVCKWKTPRTQKRCGSNREDFIKEVTGLALSSPSEQMRISVLTLLDGVQWPTASVILHFFHKDQYPIVDFRALWSLNSDVPAKYDFDFWWAYTRYCRELAEKTGLTMRELDRALWQYSSEEG